jgi:UDP-N-acetylmuramoyl-L-alanyl-D-glutamate--2,6-diaminopimelate ligase
MEENRSIAIKEGISMAKPGDVVLIAGKGHETYQISGNKKYHFDDREEAMLALKLCA